MNDSPENNAPSLCQSCGLQPAAVEFVQVSGSERRQVALCRECAATHGIGLQLDAFQRLAQLLMHQMRPVNQVSEEWQEAMSAICGRCGLLFEQFVKTGLLGCPQCYADFHDYLQPVLRRLHGVTRQVPDEPESQKTVKPLPEVDGTDSRRVWLEAELTVALRDENFERAATIRDKLKALGS